ncbi:hypothetical protein B0H17DRAFT_1147561 [Mycena rosella]|uniref:Uncharacterized protein n=1 Tax=Mycena rosella TaxID=1033263 RepID=A0AAD7CNW0_MYCRO|nr:hypothetical protein B0H17DRAFT_1147561 [Mycena rosella]
MCPTASTVAKVSPLALRVKPARPFENSSPTAHGCNGCAPNSAWPFHSSARVQRSLPTQLQIQFARAGRQCSPVWGGTRPSGPGTQTEKSWGTEGSTPSASRTAGRERYAQMWLPVPNQTTKWGKERTEHMWLQDNLDHPSSFPQCKAARCRMGCALCISVSSIESGRCRTVDCVEYVHAGCFEALLTPRDLKARQKIGRGGMESGEAGQWINSRTICFIRMHDLENMTCLNFVEIVTTQNLRDSEHGRNGRRRSLHVEDRRYLVVKDSWVSTWEELERKMETRTNHNGREVNRSVDIIECCEVRTPYDGFAVIGVGKADPDGLVDEDVRFRYSGASSAPSFMKRPRLELPPGTRLRFDVMLTSVRPENYIIRVGVIPALKKMEEDVSRLDIDVCCIRPEGDLT